MVSKEVQKKFNFAVSIIQRCWHVANGSCIYAS